MAGARPTDAERKAAKEAKEAKAEQERRQKEQDYRERLETADYYEKLNRGWFIWKKVEDKDKVEPALAIEAKKGRLDPGFYDQKGYVNKPDKTIGRVYYDEQGGVRPIPPPTGGIGGFENNFKKSYARCFDFLASQGFSTVSAKWPPDTEPKNVIQQFKFLLDLAERKKMAVSIPDKEIEKIRGTMKTNKDIEKFDKLVTRMNELKEKTAEESKAESQIRFNSIKAYNDEMGKNMDLRKELKLPPGAVAGIQQQALQNKLEKRDDETTLIPALQRTEAELQKIIDRQELITLAAKKLGTNLGAAQTVLNDDNDADKIETVIKSSDESRADRNVFLTKLEAESKDLRIRQKVCEELITQWKTVTPVTDANHARLEKAENSIKESRKMLGKLMDAPETTPADPHPKSYYEKLVVMNRDFNTAVDAKNAARPAAHRP